MLARSCCRCVSHARIHALVPSTQRPLATRTATLTARRYATTAAAGGGPGAASGAAAQVGLLAPFVTELDRLAPHVDVRGDQIQIIKTPAEFYETLKNRIRNAKTRIFLSTLYIGKLERDLIDSLADALRRNPRLRLSILTDCLRGTREAPESSCASLLAPLVVEFGPARVEIRMYHTPNLTGLRKRCIPSRINEGWGLQHMKLYGFDDEIILSGANLSTDYFTNRQDRYHLFSSKRVTNHFWRIHAGVASFSFLVTPAQDQEAGFALTWPTTNSTPSPLDDPKAFIRGATSVLKPLLTPPPPPPPPPHQTLDGPAPLQDTRVYLLGQMTQITTKPDPATELPVITAILRRLAEPAYRVSSWTFTAGYFNPAPSLTHLLLDTASSRNVVVTASPHANGFYRSPGVSGLLPDAYTLLAKRFLRETHRRGRLGDITLKEWQRGTVGEPGRWTYHAKGLWVAMPDGNQDGNLDGNQSGSGKQKRQYRPVMTIIGSSNYTKRSYSHDLEVGALIVTRDSGLRDRLAAEQAWLQEGAQAVTREDLATNERRVGLKVRIAMWIVSLVGGAL